MLYVFPILYENIINLKKLKNFKNLLENLSPTGFLIRENPMPTPFSIKKLCKFLNNKYLSAQTSTLRSRSGL